jgi:hypothetical protein
MSSCLACLLFEPEDEGDVPPKRRMTFRGLHEVIFQIDITVSNTIL